MLIDELSDKSVCVLGYGREGKATVRALEKYAGGCKEITIADQDPELQTKNYKLKTGEDYLSNLDSFDVIIKSPGIPPHPYIITLGNKVTGATQIFLDTVHEKGSKVIGVSGTKGKSTTASLLAEILKEDGKDVHLVGNIGIPTLDHLEHAKEGTLFVMEMSSFQLMDLQTSPHIAVITSFFPEHLDYHTKLDRYEQAKSNIVQHQNKDEDYVFSCSLQNASTIAAYAVVKMDHRIEYGAEDAPVDITETHLKGEHNILNMAGAWKVAEHLGTEKDVAVRAIKRFKGLPHRMQSLGVLHEIKWIDDAISTIPESTIAALDTYDEAVESIILGGQDRGIDLTSVGKAIVDSQVKNVILFPETGEQIQEALEKHVHTLDVHNVDSMEEAIKIAIKRHDSSRKDAICLLSPASPSYNMYKNYEEKGEAFAKAIRKG